MRAESPDREALLDRLCTEYLTAAERGAPPDRVGWLAAHPQLAADLAGFLDDLAEVGRRVAPLRSVAGETADETVVQSGAGERAGGVPAIRAPAGYEILDLIAEGGMGVVYLARELEANRAVALKMIRPGEVSGESAVLRFRLEAEAAAGFDHPHIVPVYEVGMTEAGAPFFSMKLVKGQTLADWIAGGWAAGGALHTAAGLRDGVRLLATVARAVHYAHQRGFLHRDLKPGNVLLDTAGVPYVTDFGLAKRLTDAADERSLTCEGGLVGTLGYMAPEQARGEKALTTAADVYPLGAILFHLLAGRPLRPVRNLAELYSHMAQEAPRPRAVNPQADRYLEAICLKCLALDPAARFGSAEALADDLERWVRGLPTRTLPPRPLRRLAMWARRRPDIAALSALTLFVLLAGVALVTWKWRAELAVRRDAQTQASRSAAVVAQGLLEEGYAGDPENQDAAALWWVRSLTSAPDGASREQATARANLAALVGRLHTLREMWELPSATAKLILAPDGRHAAVIEDGEVRLLDPRTGRSVEAGIAHPSVTAAAFSPDGGTLATTGAGGVRLWNLKEPSLPPQTLNLVGRVELLTVGPNGKRVAVVLGKEVHLYTDGVLAAGPPSLPLKITAIAFDPLGTRLATGCEDKFARVWDIDGGKWVGDRLWHDDAVRAVTFSPDGASLVTGADDHVGRVWSVGGTGPPIKLEHHDYVRGVAVSPDGRLIATAGADSAAQVWEAGSGRRVGQVLKHGVAVRTVGFAREGTELVTADAGGVVRVLAVSRSYREESSITVNSPVYAVATGQGGAEVFAGTGLGVFRIDATKNELAPQLPDPPGDTGLFAAAGVVALLGNEVWATARSQRGGWGAAGGRTADSQGWARVSSADGKFARTFPFSQPVRSLAFSPADNRLLITTADAEAGGLWEWNPLVPTTPPWPLLDKEPPVNKTPPVWAVAFSPDGTRYAASVGYGTVRVWRTAPPGAKPQTPLTMPLPWRAGALAFHPDGNRIVTGSTDRHLCIWDATTGKQLADVPAHHGAVWAVAVSPDGRLIASAGRDRCVRVWDAETGAPVGAPLHHRTAACTWGATFGADGTAIWSGNEEGSVRGGEAGAVRRWKTPTTKLDIGDPVIETWAEAVTGLRLDGDRARVLTPAEWRERRDRLDTASPTWRTR